MHLPPSKPPAAAPRVVNKPVHDLELILSERPQKSMRRNQRKADIHRSTPFGPQHEAWQYGPVRGIKRRYIGKNDLTSCGMLCVLPIIPKCQVPKQF